MRSSAIYYALFDGSPSLWAQNSEASEISDFFCIKPLTFKTASLLYRTIVKNMINNELRVLILTRR